jgi:predicted metalloprotease with PDZ domain
MVSKQILFWLSRRKSKERLIHQITFMAEQTGETEKQLETELCRLFDSCEMVKRAYLALVQYPELASPRVALCISSFPTLNEEELVDDISEIFANFKKMFDPNLFLDVIFLMDFQELQVLRVCRYFYMR